jgi:CBS domain-containing protein
MKKNLTDSIKAKSLLHKKYMKVQASQTVQEALEIMAAQEATLSLLVIDADGTPLGSLTAEGLIQHLLDGSINELESGDLPADFSDRLTGTVAELPLEKLVKLAPDDTLAIMLLRAREGSSEWLLVCDGERILGQVSLSDLYLAAANLALAGSTDDLPFIKSS